MANAKEISTIVYAAKSDDLKLLKKFLPKDMSKINDQWQGATLLYMSSQHGSSTILEFLLANGADLMGRNSLGSEVPLHGACQTGKIEVVKLLFDHAKAHPNSKLPKKMVNAVACFGWTPLHYAAQFGSLDVIQYLLEQGADPTKKDDYDQTPAEYAPHIEILQDAALKEKIKRLGKHKLLRFLQEKVVKSWKWLHSRKH